ncbi:hypothetical protein HU200_004182 [Digitaria exilis]|uniref:Acetyltransferase n=1 Tax=Digitaria exilis TaxID=1010633 RepID=A0A835FVE8_9POAL|nr:hypothetical protein HU200_004182 [Digitaria exilis]
MAPPVTVASRRAVKPPPRPRERIPLTAWDLALLPFDYLQYGLLFAPPPPTAHLVDHLHAALADALAVYYPVAGRLATEQLTTGCSVSIDCASQGAEIIHAVAADGVSVADVVPPDDDIPAAVVRSFFPLDGAINYDGHELPLFVAQVTDLADGVFVAFAYNHALSDGAALWDFLNTWAQIARAGLAAPPQTPGAAAAATASRAPPVFERWSPDGGAAAPIVLPYTDRTWLTKKTHPPPPPPELREMMLHFSPESLAGLKERAREELLAAGDEDGATAVTRFQALSSLLWRCVARARRLSSEQETVCRFAIDNRERLRPPLPAGYFGNSVYTISTEAVVPASELHARGHGWTAAAVGRAVAAHTDAAIRARVAAWMADPAIVPPATETTTRPLHGNGVVIVHSPRFDVYGCDFGWGKPLAARSGRAAKYDGRVSLFPARDGGSGGVDVEVALAPENMAALELDGVFWAAVTPDASRQLLWK